MSLALQQWRQLFIRAQNLPSSQLQPRSWFAPPGKLQCQSLLAPRSNYLAITAVSGDLLWDHGAITHS